LLRPLKRPFRIVGIKSLGWNPTGQSVWITSGDVMAIKPSTYTNQRSEASVIPRSLPGQVSHRMTPHSILSLGIEIALQCLLGGLLGQETSQMVTGSSLAVLSIINVLLRLL